MIEEDDFVNTDDRTHLREWYTDPVTTTAHDDGTDLKKRHSETYDEKPYLFSAELSLSRDSSLTPHSHHIFTVHDHRCVL